MNEVVSMQEQELQQFVAELTPEEVTYLLYLRRDKKHFFYSQDNVYNIMKS